MTPQVAPSRQTRPKVVASPQPQKEDPTFYRSRAERAIEFQAVSELKHLPEYTQKSATFQVN